MEPNDKLDGSEKDPEYKAGDVRAAAGLSYRQMHGWDAKGALPNQREGKAGWRKFTGREVFAIMVCSEIRRRFGVPVESLSYVRKFMLQEGADHLKFALERMALGLSVWLLTDLKETFIMDPDLEFEDLFRHGFFRGDQQRCFVLLNVNSIVNRMLAAKDVPPIPVSDDGVYAQLIHLRGALMARDVRELEVLQLLRQRAFRRVTVELKDGEIVHASTEAEHAGAGREVTEEQVAELLKGQRFQTITLTMHDGKVVRLNQTIPTPLKVTGTAPAPGETASAHQKDPERTGCGGRKRDK